MKTPRPCWWCGKGDGEIIDQEGGKRIHRACLTKCEESVELIKEDEAREAKANSLAMRDDWLWEQIED